MSYTLGAREFSLPDDIQHMIALGFAEADRDIEQTGASNPSRTALDNCADHFREMLTLVVPIILRTAENEPLANRREAFGLSVVLTAQLQRWVDYFEGRGFGPEKLALTSGDIGTFPCFCLAANANTVPYISLGSQRNNYQSIRSGGMIRRLEGLVLRQLLNASEGVEEFLLLPQEVGSRKQIVSALQQIAPNLPALWGTAIPMIGGPVRFTPSVSGGNNGGHVRRRSFGALTR